MRTLLFLHAALVDRVLHMTDDQAGAEFFREGIAVSNRLVEVVPGVDVEKRKGNLGRPESLGREVGHDDRVLAPGKKQRRILELRGGLAQDKNRFGLDLVEMV